MDKERCYNCMCLKEKGKICSKCGSSNTIQNELHQLPPGTVLKEQYLIGKVLGQGGFGITYLGWDMYLDIPVAVKEYFPSGNVMRESTVSLDVVSYSGDVGVRFRNNKERFLREAKMLARFSSVPEIVQIKNFFLANNTAYIVMEYVEGITLKQYIKERGGKLSVVETFALIEPVIQALCKVHKAGLVHRDISPDNIMMLPEKRMKILDFGAVRDVGEADVNQPLTKSTEAILKQGYAPIEQYQNRGSLGPWTDVYALCATIYHCLTGEVPADAPERLLGEDDLDWKKQIPELSDEKIRILEKGMALRAQDRITSMDELYELLYSEESDNTQTKKSIEVSSGNEIKAKIDSQEKVKSKGRKRAAVILLVLAVGVCSVWGIIQTARNGVYSEKKQGETKESDAEIVSGECGPATSWDLNLDTGELYIRGEGAIDDFNGRYDEGDGRSDQPWLEYIEKITTVIMEDGITVVGENAFIDCVNLKNVMWSQNLEVIKGMAFANTSLSCIKLPDSVHEITSGAFQECGVLQVVGLPSKLSVLEQQVFSDCLNLKKLYIGRETYIDYTDSLYDVTTPFSSNKTGLYPFEMVIYTLPDSSAEWFAEYMDFKVVYGTSGKCGDGVDWEFEEATGTLTISGKGQSWIYGLLKEGDITDWKEEFDASWLYWEMPDWYYLFRESITNIVIEEGVTHINHYLFADLPNLKHVDFGSVKLIDYAFVNCIGLKDITLPEGLDEIGAEAFKDCRNLETLTITADYAEIRGGAFAGCTSLREVHFSENAYTNGDIMCCNENENINNEVTFYVYKNSDMEKYAKENKIMYYSYKREN